MKIKRVRLRNFTAFKQIDMEFSGGINVFIGKNGTGKTHLLKVLYAACDIPRSKTKFADKLVKVFLPFNGRIGRLVRREKGSSKCNIEIYGTEENGNVDLKLELSFSNHIKSPDSRKIVVVGEQKWKELEVESVYIPVKEMLSNAPGFLSLYKGRYIHFPEIYADILLKAYIPPLKGPTDRVRKELLQSLEKYIKGKVKIEKDEFFMDEKGKGNLEFSLLAEGMRKLGLLWLLIQNGTLSNGNILFWDEPEANLNPSLIGQVVDILLKLQRMGVQIFLATHSYFVLKELDLRKSAEDRVHFYSLYCDRIGEETVLKYVVSDSYLSIHPNTIAETFMDIYDREMSR